MFLMNIPAFVSEGYGWLTFFNNHVICKKKNKRIQIL